MTSNKKEEPGKPGKPTPQESSDNWATESSFDTVASLDELVTRSPFKASSDKGGGSYTAAARIPVWLERKIIMLQELKSTPYGIKSDVIRDAIYLGLRILNVRYKTNPDWAVEDKMARAIDKVNELTRLQNQARDYSVPLVALWEGGDEQQAIESLEEFVGAAVEIADDWMREKTLTLLKNNRQIRPIIDASSPEVRNAVLKKKEQS